MTKPLRLAELDPRAVRRTRECKWPIGHPGESEFRFCGAATETGRVYCKEHVAKAFVRPEPRVRPMGKSGFRG